jgi:dynein heavy chain
MGKFDECLTLKEGVHAEGNIEDWLVKLQNEMQRTVKEVCREGCQDCLNMPTKEYCQKYISQVALLGIQRLWTEKVEECLEKS